MSLTYKSAGVDYDPVDEFKRYAQACANYTKGNIVRHGISEVHASRGESAYLLDNVHGRVAHVDEGLGTKNLVTEHYLKLTKKHLHHHAAQDTVAMMVNDMITLGALPLSASMHLQVDSSKWFRDRERWIALANGWKDACTLAGCNFGPGETPILTDTFQRGAYTLACSGVGIVRDGDDISPHELACGDAIVFLGSSGIHANGLTLARKLAQRLTKSYATVMDNGRTFGEALLDPTPIYARFIEACLDIGRENGRRIVSGSSIRIRYMVNITGHGWRKLMRLDAPFSYTISDLPPVPEVLKFIQKQGSVSDVEMYSTFNMGAGFALFVHPEDVEKITALGFRHNVKVYRAGVVRKSEKKHVIIEPKNVVLEGSSLAIR